jgi:hypothetical protein
VILEFSNVRGDQLEWEKFEGYVVPLNNKNRADVSFLVLGNLLWAE